jgi:dienelactone hydrolase
MTTHNTHLTAADAPITSVKPVVLSDPSRGADLQLRVSAPTSGTALPVILFSHGYGESMDGYGPLTDWWSFQGFVVLQPTYLDSRSVDLPDNDPRRANIWRQRALDAVRILDHLDDVLEAVPGLRERTDTTRIAAAGHSFGGQTTGILLGLGVIDPDSGEIFRSPDARVRAGVLMATAGRGADLSDLAAEHFPFMKPTFDQMTTPALVVLGDRDNSPLSTRGPDWSGDPYTDSPGEKHLLILHGGEHSLGGISGYDVAETTDDNPPLVQTLRHTVLAFLCHALGLDAGEWTTVTAALGYPGTPLATLQSKW